MNPRPECGQTPDQIKTGQRIEELGFKRTGPTYPHHEQTFQREEVMDGISMMHLIRSGNYNLNGNGSAQYSAKTIVMNEVASPEVEDLRKKAEENLEGILKGNNFMIIPLSTKP